MPLLSFWAVRLSLIYMFTGFTIGGLLLISKAITLHPLLWRLLSVHIEFLLIGWIVQFAMGVAFWILPRFSGERKRGNETIALSAFILLNAGIFLTVIGYVSRIWGFLPFIGRLSEMGAAVTFCIHAWPRVKPWA